MATTVVNIRKAKFDVYIGRSRLGTVPAPPAIGCFGNPYTVAEIGLEDALKMFAAYFHKRIVEDTEFRAAVLNIKDKKLGCFCRPTTGFRGEVLCHGQIIAAWLDNCRPEDII